MQRVGPEAIRQHDRACRRRTIVAHIEQPAQHRMQPHHVEVSAADHARLHLARLAQPVQSEPDGGEIAEFAGWFDAAPQVLNLRHGKRRVLRYRFRARVCRI